MTQFGHLENRIVLLGFSQLQPLNKHRPITRDELFSTLHPLELKGLTT